MKNLIAKLKKIIIKYPITQNIFIPIFLRSKASKHDIKIKFFSTHLDFMKNNKIIRISKRHLVYGPDILDSFDYYFEAVQPIELFGSLLIDYSTPRYHDVIGYEKHPVFFPSLAEPIVTTEQYLEFSNLKPGSTALDLGAYSGLASIVFKEIVGSSGQIIAVDADQNNLVAAKKNFSNYKATVGDSIDLIYGAVWNHDEGLSFSAEGNMGSSASNLVGAGRGDLINVPSYTLSHIAKKFNLDKIDFIKCDVEGAESVVFEDADFFKKYKPRIIIETHIVDGIETTEKCVSDLAKYGYTCSRITQHGVTLPLVECYPPTS